MELALDSVLADATDRLAKAVKQRRSAMHTPVVGTSDGDLRVMVLREVTPDLTLRFHTDLRSPKCALIGTGAPVGVLAYDPETRIQHRMRGEGRIEHHGPTADAAWECATASSRRCYLADTGPSALLESAGPTIPEHLRHRSPSIEETLPGRANFAVLLVEIRSLDWLQLTHEGGTRARFTRADAASPWEATWLAP